MEIGKLYKVNGDICKLERIMKFSDGSCLYEFSNEEEEILVTSYRKFQPHYYNQVPPPVTVWSDEVIPV